MFCHFKYDLLALWNNNNQGTLSYNNSSSEDSCSFTYRHSPADLRMARTQDNTVVLRWVETVTGANFSFLMVSKVELEEQTPGSLNWPLASVRARTTLGWLASATNTSATGTPVTLWTSPSSIWPSHTQRLQSSLGRPSVHTRWHLAVVTRTQTWIQIHNETKIKKTPALYNQNTWAWTLPTLLYFKRPSVTLHRHRGPHTGPPPNPATSTAGHRARPPPTPRTPLGWSHRRPETMGVWN